MKIAIVIPAYNESATIARVVGTVLSFGTVIVVDDCSSDDTGALAAEAGAEVVRHAHNGGYEAALESGFEAADRLGMDAVITFDADGQHTAETLQKVSVLLDGGQNDLVLGFRAEPARFSEFLFSAYTRWRYGISDILCGLKGYRLTLYRAHGRFDGSRSVGTELALYGLRTGCRYASVHVPILPREEGGARFGSVIRANARIVRAMSMAVVRDLRHALVGDDRRHDTVDTGEGSK